MFYAILYVIRYYIMPDKVYTGLDGLAEWADNQLYWTATFRKAAVLDAILCLIGAIICICILVYKIRKENEASSEESES